MRNSFVNLLDNIRGIVFLDSNVSHVLDVLCQLLVRLVISVVDGTSVKSHDSSESVHVIDGGCSGDLSTETVTTDSCKSDLVLIHEPDDVI